MIARAALVGAVLGATLLVPAAPAGAHALLKASQPEEGAILQEPPGEIVLELTEPPDVSLSSVQVLEGGGRSVPVGELRVPRGQPRTLVAPVEDLADGVYTVSWRVLSTVDGHVTSGAFAFGVNVADLSMAAEAPTGGTEVEPPTPLAVGGRWALYWGLALLVGAAGVSLFAFRGAWRPPAWALAGAWALAAAGLIILLLAESRAAEVGLGDLLGSARGRVLLARGAGLAVAGAAVAAALWRRGRTTLILAAAAAAGVMLVHAYAGHAGGAQTMRPFKVGVQWVHLVAVGLWIGGLVWLLVATRGREAADAAGAVRRFSNLATVGIAGVVATGALRAFDEVGLSPARYLGTGFGLALVGKVALFAPLAALGAVNRFRTVPRLEAGGRLSVLRRVVAGETALAVGILGLSGVMAGLAPPRSVDENRAAERPAGVVVDGSDFGTTVRVRLQVTPGAAGPNRFVVRVSDFDSGEPVEARGVRLGFTFPGRSDVGVSELLLEEESPGRWTGQGVNLSVEGTWRVAVLVERAGDSVTVPLELRTRLPEQDVTVSEAPGQPTLYTIALPGGLSVQGYADPGAPGPNEIHFTFFSADGGEQPVDSARITASVGDDPPQELQIRELSPGHFVGPVDLRAGRWLFRVEARAADGATLSAYFQHTIGEETA